MKKLLIFLSLMLFAYPSVAKMETVTIPENFIVNYRRSPFQWIFPEHFYKAETYPVTSEKKLPSGYKPFDFFGLKSCLPSKYAYEISKKNNIISMRSANENKDRFLIISALDNSYFPDGNNKKTPYKTARELYHKLFTLTPDKASTTEERLLVHSKAVVFEEIKEIKVYTGKNFKAFLKVIKDDLVKKTTFAYELTIFHENSPSGTHLIVCFPRKEKETLNNFLSML